MASLVLVLCPNPALDRVALAPGAAGGGTVRATEVLETPGGKGLHVALVARELGASVNLVAPLGGPNGAQVAELLEAERLAWARIPIAGSTRATFTLVDAERADVVEVIEPSPDLSEQEVDALLAEASRRLEEAGVVACSGSVPDGVSPDLYGELTRRARAAGTTMLVDASGPSLAAALAAGPDLVAPNVREASALLDEEAGLEPEELARLGRLLLDRGARNAIVSAGEAGSALVLETGARWHLAGRAERVVNAVGCGDALLGGIAAALASGTGLLDAAVLGTAAALDKLARLHPGKVEAASVARIARNVNARRLEG